MNKKSKVASAVINKQLNSMYNQERKALEHIPIYGLEEDCPYVNKDQLLWALSRAAVQIKISIMSRLN